MLTTSIELNSYKGAIIADIFTLGPDYFIVLRGPGEHIGAVSLGESYKRKSAEREASSSVSTITSFGHRDNIITDKLAYILSKNLKTTVLVCGGIHIDNISKDQLLEIIEIINPLSSKIISKIFQD